MTAMKTGFTQEEKSKAMVAAMASFKKSYGDIMVSGTKSEEELREALMKVEVISTGSLTLDSALGVWGFPRGRVVELYGAEHSGKTSIALQAIGCAQAMGGNALFLDVEQSLDALFAMKNNCNYATLNHIKPTSGDEAMNILQFWLQKNCEAGIPLMDIIVVDSVAALVTEGQIEKGIGNSEMAIGARLLSQTLRNITPFLHGCVVIFINQMRDKPGVMYGAHEDTPGGRALKYYSSIRCKVNKVSPLYLCEDGGYVAADDKGGKKKIREAGRRVKVTVEKNKVAPKGVRAEFDFLETIGIVRERELANLALDYGIVKPRGAYYDFPDGASAHGMDQLVNMFREDVDAEKTLMQQIQKIVYAKRLEEVNKAIHTLGKQRNVFDMWNASNATVDVLDNDDKPPEETAADAPQGTQEAAAQEPRLVSRRKRTER